MIHITTARFQNLYGKNFNPNRDINNLKAKNRKTLWARVLPMDQGVRKLWQLRVAAWPQWADTFLKQGFFARAN